MERMATMPMHTTNHVFTRALVSDVCAWHVNAASIGNVPFAFAASKAKAYGARRLGSTST